MANITIRVSAHARDLLREIARKEGTTMQSVVDSALEAYRRKRFLEKVNEGYAELERDPEEWAALRTEHAAWEATLCDGLPTETATKPSSVRKKKRR
ncbi:toxin-antitoxin system protein [Planctomycetota bacterium]